LLPARDLAAQFGLAQPKVVHVEREVQMEDRMEAESSSAMAVQVTPTQNAPNQYSASLPTGSVPLQPIHHIEQIDDVDQGLSLLINVGDALK